MRSLDIVSAYLGLADDREVLQDAGKITTEIARTKAETDFYKYMLELEENAKK